MSHAVKKPPVFPGNFLFGSAADFLRDPLSAFLDGWRRCGEVVCFRFMGRLPFAIAGTLVSRIVKPLEIYLVAHPALIKHVLQDRHQNYLKDPTHSAQLRALAGNGLTMSEGEVWRTHRRIMQPAFRRQHNTEFVTHISTATTAMLDRWDSHYKSGKPIDVYSEMMHLAFDIVARSMFGRDLTSEARSIVRDSTTVLEHAYRGMRTMVPLPDWLPLPPIRRFIAARQNLIDLAGRLVLERKRQKEDVREDLLSLLVSSVDESDARDEVITTILAGHDTTGVALTWSLFLLAQNREADRRLRSSSQAALAGRLPEAVDLSNLEYAGMVVKEAMRLFPPAWVLSRQAAEPDEVGGFLLPAGATVFLSPFVTHRHPQFWRDANRFDPERFASNQEPAHQFSYFPFGGGPRLCIGNHFALTAAQVALSMISRSYELSLAPSQSIRPRAKLTLHPNRQVLMMLEKPTPV